MKNSFIYGIVLAVVLMMASVGCRTSEGFGEDVQDLGDEIEDAAD